MKINPKQLEKMAKRMGIETKAIEATEVIIRTQDKEIVISNPSVSRINMMGQDSWQITGDVSERSPASDKPTDDDVKMVMQQAGASEDESRQALSETNGDIAEAILKLKK